MTEALEIQAFTYEQRHGLLDALDAAFSHCGGWMLDRKTLSTTNMEFHIEIQLRAALELYASLLGAGVELTRTGHESLTELCTRRLHLRRTADLGQTIEIRLEVAFLDDIALHSLLSGAPGVA